MSQLLECTSPACRELFELVLGNISEKLITTGVVTPDTIYASQKAIRDGKVAIGISPDERQLIHESNIDANADDHAATISGYDGGSESYIPDVTLGNIIAGCYNDGNGDTNIEQYTISHLSENLGGGGEGGDWATSVYLR